MIDAARPLISVIVPIYNQERLLSACLDSILCQTYPNIEVIAINDCSTDGTMEILRRYALADTRVVIIDSPENCGTCISRNKGIDAARGTYIGFVDDDDTIEPEMYQRLLDAMLEAEADVGICGCIGRDELGNVVLQAGWNDQTEIYDRSEALRHLHVDDKDGRYLHTTQWNKLYTRSIIGSTRVDPACGGSEDYWFIHEILMKADSVVRIPGAYYRINLRSGSISRSPLSYRSINALEAHRRIVCSLEENYPAYVPAVLIRYTLALGDASLRGVHTKKMPHAEARRQIRAHAKFILDHVGRCKDREANRVLRSHLVDIYFPAAHDFAAALYALLHPKRSQSI